ncbi:hypothetical protein KIN20_030648 [Parelaphostrongylus tenuis]|uniref:Uncharacterized protein n=1 Tax=Parelaphostrongylus tenuis TaxID=148309 RepID=A0AAD5R431_PARTN|nr:hypothetical protein KIN20_030648 [Parelaphostrongylus tenuis]
MRPVRKGSTISGYRNAVSTMEALRFEQDLLYSQLKKCDSKELYCIQFLEDRLWRKSGLKKSTRRNVSHFEY